MKNYTVTTTENLRSLCIKNGWFTCGSNRQYEKLFYANEHGASIAEIATIIWLCSNTELGYDGTCRRDILCELKAERVRFWKAYFNIENENQVFLVYDVFDIIYQEPFEDFVDILCDPEIDDVTPENIVSICTLDNVTVWEYE